MSDVWYVRAEIRALNDEDLRELITYAQAQLAERGRLAIERAAQIRSDADEIDLDRKTDPGPSFDDPIDVKSEGQIRVAVQSAVLPITEWDDQ